MRNTRNEAGILRDLPRELHYLIEPVLEFACRSEHDIYRHLDSMSEEQREALATIADRVLWNDHYTVVNEFLDQNEITNYRKSAMLYFFFGLLDYAGLDFDRVFEGNN